MMRRGQGLGFVMGILIALLILFSLSFASCTILKQQTSIQSRINFDLVASYLQQCQQSGQQNCYCDPPLTLERTSSEESLSLKTYGDGLYLELSKGDEQPLSRKKIHDQPFCTYSYSLQAKSWSSRPTPSYTFAAGGQRFRPTPSYTFADGDQRFIVYVTQEGALCFLQGYFSMSGPGITQEAATSLRSCNAQDSSLTFFLHQRHPSTTTDNEQTILLGQQFMAAFQQTFTTQGSVFVSTIRVQSRSYGGPYTYLDYSRPTSDAQQTFSSVASKMKQNYAKNFMLLSPQLALSEHYAPKDSITLAYLADSPSSKLLAERLQYHLQQLSDKSYRNTILLSSQDADYQRYLFSFDVQLVPVTTERPDILFFQPWIKKDYASFFDQRAVLPAVFIDFTDAKNKFSLFEAHHAPLAQALLLGVQDYLQQQAQPKQENLLAENNKQWRWAYNDKTYEINIPLSNNLYELYLSKPHPWKRIHESLEIAPFPPDFSYYVLDSDDDVLINDIATKIANLAKTNNIISDFDKIYLATSFVKGRFIYEEDIASKQCTEYPRYPIELLVEGGGDCEDAAILTAAILNALYEKGEISQKTVFLDLVPNKKGEPGHSALGISCSESSSTSIQFGGYCYFESSLYDQQCHDVFRSETNSNIPVACVASIGEMPETIKNDMDLSKTTIYEIKQKPILHISFDDFLSPETRDGKNYINFKITIVNYGLAAANNLDIYIVFKDKTNKILLSKHSEIANLEPKQTTTQIWSLPENGMTDEQADKLTAEIEIIELGYSAGNINLNSLNIPLGNQLQN